MSFVTPTPTTLAITRWCRRWLGAELAKVLWSRRHLSHVYGIELDDGRSVVLKIRASAPRIAATVDVQEAVAGAGFPTPAPLTRPHPLGEAVATAEALVEGGVQLPRDGDAPALFAAALARLTALTRARTVEDLAPPPAWVWWDHPFADLWPPADDRPFDLNQLSVPRIDEAARHARKRLAGYEAPPVVSHCDWESQNMRWIEGRLHVVYDWDSIAARPEATIAGAAGAVFTSTGAATVDESCAFLDAYESSRGRAFSRDDREAYWAAGLWVRSFNAKKESGDPIPPPSLAQFFNEVDQRTRLAGG